MSIRGICFDMDGILTNTEEIGSEMLMHAIELQGLRVTPEQWHQMIGASWEATCRMITSFCGPTFDSDRFMIDWKQLTLDWMRANGVPLMPYAAETVRSLHEAGFRLAVCTSNARDVVETYLELSGLKPYFSAVVTADDVRHAKPAPDVYLAGACALSLQPDECIGVEDSYTGVRSVRRASLRCVMIPDQLPYIERLAYDVDYVLKDLRELSPLIEKINERYHNN